VRSTAAPYTESRLTHLVRNKCVGFPVVEQYIKRKKQNSPLNFKYFSILDANSFFKNTCTFVCR
jgi:hypothetical protein